MSIRVLICPLPISARPLRDYHSTRLSALLNQAGHKTRIVQREEPLLVQMEQADVALLEVDTNGNLGDFQRLRQQTRKPVLLYGVGIPKAAQVNGLSAGADGILILPEADEVLHARLSAFFRRIDLT